MSTLVQIPFHGTTIHAMSDGGRPFYVHQIAHALELARLAGLETGELEVVAS